MLNKLSQLIWLIYGLLAERPESISMYHDVNSWLCFQCYREVDKRKVVIVIDAKAVVTEKAIEYIGLSLHDKELQVRWLSAPPPPPYSYCANLNGNIYAGRPTSLHWPWNTHMPNCTHPVHRPNKCTNPTVRIIIIMVFAQTELNSSATSCYPVQK